MVNKLIPAFFAMTVFIFINCIDIIASQDNIMTIRSEGGSKIEDNDKEFAKEKAIQNAIRKAVRSEVYEIVYLSKSESERILPSFESNVSDYIAGYDINNESVFNNALRVILDVQVIPQKITDSLIDVVDISSFRNKPRLLVILSEDQIFLSTAIEKGFVSLGFQVISGKENELRPYLDSGDIDKLVKTALKLGGEVVITGECTWTKLEDKRLGSMVSWQNEVSLKAIRCQDSQVLSAGNFKGAELTLNEQTGKRKASEKIANELLKDFPKRIIKVWSTDLALGKIKLSPYPMESEPPQLFVDKPIDQAITDEITTRLSGYVKSEQSPIEIRLKVNNSLLALDNSAHLISDENATYFNRQIPLKVGENTISVLAIDQNKNIVEKSLKVICDPSRKENRPSVEIKINSPLPNQNVKEAKILVTGEVISSVPLKDYVNITVNHKEPMPFRGMKVKRNPEKENELSLPIHKEILLTPGYNDIEIMVMTEDNQEFKTNIPVIYTPTQLQPSEKRKFAVIIGIDKYKDPDIEDLKVAGVDAKSIYEIITDPKGGGFPVENVKLLLNEQATRESITNALGEWLPSQANPNDIVLIFYSGHGGIEPDPTGEEPDGNSKYIIPYDANPDNLFLTAIQNSTLSAMLQRILSNQMIFLIDCCYSGGTTTGQETIKSISPPNTKVGNDVYDDFSGTGHVVISASLPDQVSYEIPKLNHGIFTYNLLEAVYGKADFNDDGMVTLIAEIYPFISQEVVKMAHSFGFRQNPTLKCQVIGDPVLSGVINK
ncbi:MAG: caspase family protein [Candidatus Poribacteria bacterium]